MSLKIGCQSGIGVDMVQISTGTNHRYTLTRCRWRRHHRSLPYLSSFKMHFYNMRTYGSKVNQKGKQRMGCGMCRNEISLRNPLVISFLRRSEGEFVLKKPFPDFEGSLISFSIKMLHELTGLPMDSIHLETVGLNPCQHWVRRHRTILLGIQQLGLC